MAIIPLRVGLLACSCFMRRRTPAPRQPTAQRTVMPTPPPTQTRTLDITINPSAHPTGSDRFTVERYHSAWSSRPQYALTPTAGRSVTGEEWTNALSTCGRCARRPGVRGCLGGTGPAYRGRRILNSQDQVICYGYL